MKKDESGENLENNMLAILSQCGIMNQSNNIAGGYSSLVEHQLPKLDRRVRFPLSASV